ncbi:MAG: copper resistance protein CopC, partial [Dehalococcoidia bacterium]
MRLLLIRLALIMALASVTLVSGHAAPERFTPPPGAVLDEVPSRVDGFFTQDIRRTEESFLQVFGEAGNRVSRPAVIDDADRRHMYTELQPGLGLGRYLVAWQTMSDEDDEVDGGCFLFFVGQEAADQAHQERMRIDAPQECPVNIGDEEEEEGHSEEEPLATIEGDEGVPVAALIGAAVGSGAAMLLVGS